MRPRAAWNHWWTVVAVICLALVPVIASYGDTDHGDRLLVPLAAGLALVVISTVINRPRPRTQEWEPATDVDDQRAAIAAVRRGTAVDPPEQQRQAVDAVRREWFAFGMQFGIVSTISANLVRQSRGFPQGLVDVGVVVLGHLILIGIVIGMAYFALVLRRVDGVEARCGL